MSKKFYKMPTRFGCAKTLGNRALNHVDLRALSFSLIIGNLNGLLAERV